MFVQAKEQRVIAQKTIYNRLNEAIEDAANKGAMYLWLDQGSPLCINLHNHPEKNKILAELNVTGYSIHERIGGSIKISWE